MSSDQCHRFDERRESNPQSRPGVGEEVAIEFAIAAIEFAIANKFAIEKKFHRDKFTV